MARKKSHRPLLKLYQPLPRVGLDDVETTILKPAGLQLPPGVDQNIFSRELRRCRRSKAILTLTKLQANRTYNEANQTARHVDAVFSSIPDRLLPDKKLLELPIRAAIEKLKQEAHARDFSIPVSAVEWIVGIYLAELFVRVFDQSVTNATGGRPNPAFVYFVIATLKANGIFYSPKSVYTALKQVADKTRIKQGTVKVG
jgi:hypothetical protein